MSLFCFTFKIFEIQSQKLLRRRKGFCVTYFIILVTVDSTKKLVIFVSNDFIYFMSYNWFLRNAIVFYISNFVFEKKLFL